MDSIEYLRLYELQDKVLTTVFKVEDEFYLTGGTALSRFYQEKRYSDDLDLFTNDSSRFNYAVKNIVAVLVNEFKVEYELESRDFIRIKISVFTMDDLVIRLKSFPIGLLKHIQLIDSSFLDTFQDDFTKLIEKIQTYN